MRAIQIDPGYEQVAQGRPLFKNDQGKIKLAWCPICGPSYQFDNERLFARHFEKHEPEDLGLGGKP